VVGVEIGESLYNRHDVKFNNIPTSLEEFATEPIRPGSLIGRHVPNGILHLILRKRIIQTVQGRRWEVDGIPIEGNRAGSWPTIRRGEVTLGDRLLVIMGGNPTVVAPKLDDEVFPSASIHLPMEVFRVCIPISKVFYAGHLSLSSPFEGRQANHSSLKPCVNVTL
jgi:hypothetical protein